MKNYGVMGHGACAGRNFVLICPLLGQIAIDFNEKNWVDPPPVKRRLLTFSYIIQVNELGGAFLRL